MSSPVAFARTVNRRQASRDSRAFAVAQQEARHEALEWLVSGDTTIDERDAHITRVYDALVAGTADPTAGMRQAVEDLLPREAFLSLEDRLVDAALTTARAGYLYGLALGLELAKGGTR